MTEYLRLTVKQIVEIGRVDTLNVNILLFGVPVNSTKGPGLVPHIPVKTKEHLLFKLEHNKTMQMTFEPNSLTFDVFILL